MSFEGHWHDDICLKLGCTIQEVHALRSIKSTMTFPLKKLPKTKPHSLALLLISSTSSSDLDKGFLVKQALI